jgi:hypothetical protein
VVNCWYGLSRHALAKSTYSNSRLGLEKNRGEFLPHGDTLMNLQTSFRVSESECQRLMIVPVYPLLPIDDSCRIAGAETPRLAANTLAGTIAFWQRLLLRPCVLIEDDRRAPGLYLVHAMVSNSMLVQAY